MTLASGGLAFVSPQLFGASHAVVPRASGWLTARVEESGIA